MKIHTALKRIDKFEKMTDLERIRVLIQSMDQLNNGDALEFLDHWISAARPLLVVNPSSLLSHTLEVKSATSSGEVCDI